MSASLSYHERVFSFSPGGSVPQEQRPVGEFAAGLQGRPQGAEGRPGSHVQV